MINRNACVASLFVLFFLVHPAARGYDALSACRSQSFLTSEIHDCMDNYLGLLDSNLDDLTRFIDSTLEGSDRAAFNRAQNAFYSYRRENCLWYLEITDSRVEGEQVAKNCLSDMSQQRLSELQSLVAEYQNPGAAELVESLADAADSTESELTPDPAIAVSETDPPVTNDAASAAKGEPEGLSAYLGEWQVTCEVDEGSSRCVLDVPLVPLNGEESGSTLRIVRRSNERATAELRFPEKTINSPDQILWRIDNFAFGAVPGSIISVSDGVTRQVINERRFMRDDLMPLFRSGSEVGITTLDKTGDASGEGYKSTLVGFSRALTFADEYINGQL